jgi:hypothetical protein
MVVSCRDQGNWALLLHPGDRGPRPVGQFAQKARYTAISEAF